MIPYFNQPSLSLGPVSIHAFGVLIAIGILASLLLIRRRAQFLGLDLDLSKGMVTWILAAGFIMAHIFDRIAYFPRETFNDPLSLLKIWAGISSFGGFIGAAIGALLFIWHSKMGTERWHYLDLLAYSFPIGWLFGRTGCFVAYDHPGTPTAFFLGQAYRDGVVRHNLGLEEAIYTLLIAALFFALGHKNEACRVFRRAFIRSLCPRTFFSGLSAHNRRPIFSTYPRPIRFYFTFNFWIVGLVAFTLQS